jgi:hypothetical protein
MDTHPVGFFNNNTWNIIGCQYEMMRTREKLVSCLHNTHILLIGDSTVMKWHKTLADRLQLKRFGHPGRSTKLNPKYWSSMKDTEHNFIAEFVPHGTAISMAGFPSWNRVDRMTPSTASYLDDLERNSSTIVVFHFYGHVIRYPTAIFESRIAQVRDAVERLYARAPNVQVFIKGPHAFLPRAKYVTHDIYGKVYSDIIHRVFDNLRDKVVFLDNWDMTVGMGEFHNIHPNRIVGDAMVDQLLAYIC